MWVLGLKIIIKGGTMIVQALLGPKYYLPLLYLLVFFVIPYGSLFILQGTPVWKYLASLIIWEERSGNAQYTVMALLGLSCLFITFGVTVISCLIQSHFIKPNQIKLEQQ